MITKIPTITQNFLKSIEQSAQKGTYRLEVGGIIIDVFPYIFPPQSSFSESTFLLYTSLNRLNGLKILDLGTGTGIQAIRAALAGADEVDAIDIYPPAVECARHNVLLNHLEDKIKIWQSDLFKEIPLKKYDLIIANLPIIESDEAEVKLPSLFDPGFRYHERLFRDSPAYLSNSGRLSFTFANLQNHNFKKLERLAVKYGFYKNITKKFNALGYEWRNYEFKPKCE